MVNREQRAEARELILQFMAGEITNDDFGDVFPAKTEDAALRAIDQMLWFWYDDLKTYRLTGKHELVPKEKELGERCALFLSTDLEYEWPDLGHHGLLNPILAFIGGEWFRRKRVEQAKKLGDYSVWPFFRIVDYERAKLRTPNPNQLLSAAPTDAQ